MDKKDLLIAWAYDYIRTRGEIKTSTEAAAGEDVRVRTSRLYGSAEMEFFFAAEKVVPHVDMLSRNLPSEHADVLVSDQ